MHDTLHGAYLAGRHPAVAPSDKSTTGMSQLPKEKGMPVFFFNLGTKLSYDRNAVVMSVPMLQGRVSP